ncbi:MAG: hypothetical protein WCK30_06465, partial [Actinomycetes bacterium]
MVGILFRIVFLGLVDSLAFWAGSHLLVSRNWLGLVWLLVATIAINYVYISKRARASRWLLPGTILLIVFQIYPIMFTATAAFSNYSTAHFISRPEAIDHIVLDNIQLIPDSPQYSIVPIHDGKTVALLVTDPTTNVVYLGTQKSFKEITNPKFDATGVPRTPVGWLVYSEAELNTDTVLNNLSTLLVPMTNPKGSYLKVNDFTTAYQYASIVIYDAKKDQLIRQSDGYVFPEREGAFIDSDGTALDPGWRV